MTTEEWTAIYTVAGVQKAIAGDLPVVNGIIGRSITFLVGKLVDFWGAHSATLIPYLTQAAIAALNALLAARADIDRVNPRGPR